MIPLHLRITGFLSYRDTVELDFDSFDLACISGHNGAGKSSLLDAITWSLFGEARGKSSDVINLYTDVKAAEVAFTFQHEGNVYRVQRSLPKNKSTVLEFQVKNISNSSKGDGVEWKPLTEKTTRDTQARIEQTLRLDYETFVNASFFLQGKADQFTQQNASKRKEVLSNILGLEVWEEYKTRTAEKRKRIEAEVETIDGRIAEIDSELAEEEHRTIRLRELQGMLNQLSAAREAGESALQNARRNIALLDEQRKLTSTLASGLERARTALASLDARLASKDSDRHSYLTLLNRAAEIESAHKAWQAVRKELERFEKTATQFHEHQHERTPLLATIAAEKARLEEERRGLLAEAEEIGNQSAVSSGLKEEIDALQTQLKDVEANINKRAELETERNTGRERQAALKVENDSLKAEMASLKERIDALSSADGVECPLCGQELTEKHRKATLKQLEVEGKQKGDAYRANQKETTELNEQITKYQAQISQLSSAETQRIKLTGEISQLSERLERLQGLTHDWEKTGRKRLKDVEKLLESEKYAAEEQKQLAKLDKELAKLGYDTAAHDTARDKENELRGAEEDFVNLKAAKDVSKQIESEMKNIEEERGKRKEELDDLQAQFDSASAVLNESVGNAPSLEGAERDLVRLREEENKARAELGGAQQRVDVLKTQRARKADYEKERDQLSQQIARHKTLENAFGKNGVPALLIEQALPQIEEKANDLLERLSDGAMSVRFVTQAEYKDKKRDDLKETLEINISDGVGNRSYEMYSGGEAFRVNFAIRLALSEILAQRKGARLQTLVIDEGFGSQDALGRQRLVEAINLVKNDFAKILVITHLDELKDAFPNRVEIEKTERGSVIRVV